MKRQLVATLRGRLREALNRAELSQSACARLSGVDRSTLSQLLSEDNTRLPRADTVALLATHLRVSADWLLGLSAEARSGAEVVKGSLEIAHTGPSPAETHLARWHEEAAGYKIRYVPSNLPDLLKTDALLHFEFDERLARSPDLAIAATQHRLEYTREPDTDMEVCMSRQDLEAFARGEGIWRGLEKSTIRAQLRHMTVLLDELYPEVRLFLFDGRKVFTAPYTVFGPKRAAIFMGQLYFVFNTTEHVRALSRHFDQLVRQAEVHAHEASAFVAGLMK